MIKRCFFMDEKEYMANLLDEKSLFDEILPPVDDPDYKEELSQEYKSGIEYEKALKKHKDKNKLY